MTFGQCRYETHKTTCYWSNPTQTGEYDSHHVQNCQGR